MIFCVVPEPLADELYDKLVRYYEADDNVTVIVDRRQGDRRGRLAPSAAEAEQRERRDRRRQRIPGEFPGTPAADDA